MTASRIVIFEKKTGGSNKFYTMIDQGNGQFVCNYGIDDGKGWNKSILKPMSLWDSTINDRQKHGYTHAYTGFIDYDKYVMYLRKMAELHTLIGDDKSLLWINYVIVRTGKMDAAEMTLANSLYKQFKRK